MSLQATVAKVRTGLADALASGNLPGNLLPKAEALLAALDKPVRLTLMGLPGTGKSQLMNLLAGADVVPNGMHLPTTQLVYGEVAKSKCTMPDGSVEVLDHCDVAEIAALHPVFVQLALPLPALRRISVLEVVARDDNIDQQRAMFWAAKRTDVALWCTQSFNIPEQTLWGAMPDIIKDHGFMVVTKADVLSRNELLQATLSNVRTVGEHEFNQILPVATLSAIDARLSDGSVDKEAMRRSGGLALISAILRQVDLGQQATIDQAAMILRQTEQVATSTPAKIKPPVQEKTIVETVAAANIDEPTVAAPTPTAIRADVTPTRIEPSAHPKRQNAQPAAKQAVPKAEPIEPEAEVEKASTKPTKVASEDEFPEPIPVKKKAPPPKPTLKDGSRKAYEDAISYLTREGRALANAVETSEKVPVAKIMSRSVDNVQWLADHLQDNGEDDDPILQRARETALDAADLIQLMQMEKHDSAVFDAVSLVVQLKYDLEADLAH
ncbi:hypothetical protein SAMN04488515_2938 [Cognatiyoonia koreensis]|uniref:50S ribosome-binding GTPase n=1 Tax=Cognatiyoonia koreensis TaxID=364200 RepID=A0A1I0RM67_9RHOB|nr:hypothetical protein [Cognatiyoonia koreensis]SEW42217.1 hypothetical protein SAMN04488515_2938 [Cognatiyoonia koreensis]